MNNFEEHLINVLLERNNTINEISAERIEQAIERQTGRKQATLAARQRQGSATLDKWRETKGNSASPADAMERSWSATRDLKKTEKQAARIKRRAERHPTT